MDVCAIDAAMRDWYDKGESVFARGQQNMPLKKQISVLNIEPKDVESRVDPDRKAGQVPDWVDTIVAATDINPSYALSTVIVGFGTNQRASVLWYGLSPMDTKQDETDAVKQQKLMIALEKLGREIHTMPCIPASWIIDAGGGGAPRLTIQTFSLTSQRTCGLVSLAAFGVDARGFKPWRQDKKYEQAYIRREDNSRLKRAFFDSGYYRELAQRSFVGAIGSAGSTDLFIGRHTDFAQQVCNEKLAGKVELNGKIIYDWRSKVGQPHDYLDCMAMAFAMAAMSGIGTGGQVEKKKRSSSVVIGGKTITTGEANAKDKQNTDISDTTRRAVIGRRR